MQLDLATHMMFEPLDIGYGNGADGKPLPRDKVGPIDLIGLSTEIQEWYTANAGKKDKETGPALRQFLIEKGFSNLPPYEFASHALAGNLVKIASERKKKYENDMRGSGAEPHEWPAIIPDSPAS